MPNWVENTIKVSGKREDVEKFVEKVRGEVLYDDDGFAIDEQAFDFEKILPYPEAFKKYDEALYGICEAFGIKDTDHFGKLAELSKLLGQKIKDGFNTGGCGWCCQNWGTNWNSCDSRFKYIHDFDDDIHESAAWFFNTAWDTPRGIWFAVAEQHPELRVEVDYFSTENFCDGKYVFENGILMGHDEAELIEYVDVENKVQVIEGTLTGFRFEQDLDDEEIEEFIADGMEAR